MRQGGLRRPAPFGSEREPQRRTAADRHPPLLLLRIPFDREAHRLSATDRANAPAPTARAVLRSQSERRAVAERSDRVAERSAQDLASPALELEACPGAVV